MSRPINSDPMMSRPAHDIPCLFRDTSSQAGFVAAGSAERRYRQILDILSREPRTLFEVASELGLLDHQISGRFTELAKERLIERSGQRRQNPSTGCTAEVWQLATQITRPEEAALTPDAAAQRRAESLADAAGYPQTLTIDGELYDRASSSLNPDPKTLNPGCEYTRRADTGGIRLTRRVSLLRCPVCEKPIRQVTQDKPPKFHCGTEGCAAIQCRMIAPPGSTSLLTLILA